MFQCSSASRKFLNALVVHPQPRIARFQCSSASRKFLNVMMTLTSTKLRKVSVLFSEPKIPQCFTHFSGFRCISVSVLFSEPKIPQCIYRKRENCNRIGFSALQRAENSSIPLARRARSVMPWFQCSSASRKFLNRTSLRAWSLCFKGFSALQRAENSSIEMW